MRNYFPLFIFILPVFFSCSDTKKIMYFNSLKDSTILKEVEVPEYKIQKNDILSIVISSIDADATKLFNYTNKSESLNSTSNYDILETSGYLVNRNGDIRFLILGSIKAEGLTKDQLAEYIRKEISDRKILVDPLVEIRMLTFKVTVLGEVDHPLQITVKNEKISILEALGIAGDLTIFANRTNILLLRTEGGKRIARRIDLTSTKILNSPYYNLRPNDVIYVEPNKAKAISSTRLIALSSIIVTGLYLLLSVFTQLTK